MPRRLVGENNARLDEELGVAGPVQDYGEVQARRVGIHIQRERPLPQTLIPVLDSGFPTPVVCRLHHRQAVIGLSRCEAKIDGSAPCRRSPP